MRTASLRDLAADGHLTYSDGYRTKKAELAPDGYRIIRVADVGNDVVRLDSPDFVGGDRTPQIGVKAAEPGDILLTTKGTVGRVAIMPETPGRSVYSPQLCFFRIPEGSGLVTGYFKAWLRSPDFWRQAAHSMNNTDMAAYISLRDLGLMTLPVLALPEQRAIAEVLGALDDKIAANATSQQFADELRRLLFATGLEGDGGESTPLSSLARFVNGRNFTKDASGVGRPVIRIAELNSGLGGSTVYNDVDVAEDHVARPGDLLFAWSGSLTLRRWFLADGIVNQHIFKVLPTEGRPLWLIAALLEQKLDEFKAIAADKATTMGHIQRRHLDEPVSLPTARWLAQNALKLESLWNVALATEIETQKLIVLRDTLLPELMSGRLRVKDAAKTVEEVV